MDLSSPEETVTCTYNGPQKILIVVNTDETFSVEHLPLEDEEWEDVEEGLINDDPDNSDRYMVLNASNDDHIVLMQIIAGNTQTENTNPIEETISTYTFNDGSTFVLKYKEDNPIDPQQIVDAASIRINPEGNISYNFRENDNNTDDELIHALDRAILRSNDKANDAESVATTKLYRNHALVCTWIKEDLVGTVPRHKLIIPNIVDVELGASYMELTV